MSFIRKLQNNYFAGLLCAILTYYVAGKIGFFLSEGSGFAAVVWPPAGAAIMVLYYFGIRVWPGILIGAFIVSVSNNDALISYLGVILEYPHYFSISVGGTLQAVLITWVIRKYKLIDHDFSSPRKIGWFYLVVGPLGSLISATVACLTFWILGFSTFISLTEEWVIWWIADSSAAIIFTTLVFGAVKFDLNRKKIVGSFITVGLLLAFTILYIGKNWENERLELIFNQKVAAAIDKLGQFTLAHLSLENNLKGFVGFRTALNKSDFEQFSQNNLQKTKAIRSLAWIEEFTTEQRLGFEAKLQEDHGPEVLLWETSADKKRIPAKSAKNYKVVKYIEPYADLKFVVGHVIGVDENRKAALRKALETGNAILSAPVILTSEPITPSAATIYRAHFNGDQLNGYTAIAIRIDSMIDDILGKNDNPSFYVSLYDKEYGEELTFKSYAKDNVSLEGLKSQTIEFSILNRIWVLTFTRTPEFAAENKNSQPMFIAISGMIFASLVTICIVIFSGQRTFLEKLVMQRTADLEKANQAKSEFMANMSHDLRTPLNAIIGFSEIMKNQMFGAMGSEKYLEYTKDINHSSQYLLSLINDILDYSAIAADKRSIDKEKLDLALLVSECLRSLDPLINDKRLSITVDFPEEYPAVLADKRSIKQILINLISNSIKFTSVGGKIMISGVYSNVHVRFTVSDNGEGIDQKSIAKVFDPFARVEDNPHLSREGSGLGLAIVSSLVKLHQGTITLDSVVGEGTDITVELPR